MMTGNRHLITIRDIKPLSGASAVIKGLSLRWALALAFEQDRHITFWLSS